MEMRVMVTGGAGFIGSAVCRSLICETSAEVLNIDKLTYAANPASLAAAADSPRYHFVNRDICDGNTMAALFADFRPDTVIHLAAESHVDRSIAEPAAFVQTNIVGTFMLLEVVQDYWRRLGGKAKETFRLLHVSTDEVFGSLGRGGCFSEGSPYDPSSPYSASKAASDHLVRAWYRTYDVPAIVVTSSNNYGPYQHPEKLIPVLILSGVRAAPMPVYGDGSNVRDWLYVDDHVRALRLIAEHGQVGQTYLVGGNAERRNIDVALEICALLDELNPAPSIGSHRDLIRFVDDRPGHDFRYAIDASRVRETFRWQPAETFESGLRRTVEWYLANPGWVAKFREPLRTRAYDSEELQ